MNDGNSRPWWSPDPPWNHRLLAAPDLLRELQDRPEEAYVFSLRGEVMRTHDGLFDEYARVLKFPNYFGRNWPALEDCLRDMTWLDEKRAYLTVIYDSQQVLEQSPNDRSVLENICSVAGREWGELGHHPSSGPVSFNTLFLLS